MYLHFVGISLAESSYLISDVLVIRHVKMHDAECH
jgi:hypothetical protein